MIGFLTIVILVFLIKPKLTRFFEIDKCLDSGGRWNYELEQCEYADIIKLETDTIGLK